MLYQQWSVPRWTLATSMAGSAVLATHQVMAIPESVDKMHHFLCWTGTWREMWVGGGVREGSSSSMKAFLWLSLILALVELQSNDPLFVFELV